VSRVRPVTPEEARRFDADGVVLLRGVFEPKWIEMLRSGVEQAMANPSPLAKDYGAKTSGRFFGDYNMWKRFAVFREFTCQSPAAESAALLMGSTNVNLYNEHLLVKEPGSATARTPWHQDLPYFRLTGRQMCSVWIPLDSATAETGAMSFVRGSHRWGRVFRPMQFRNSQSAEVSTEFEDLPDLDSAEYRAAQVSFDLEPGDCTVHHALTLHSAGGNQSETARRRALSIRYIGDDVRWFNRAFAPEEDNAAYVQLDKDVGLATGDRLDGPDFPRVWPRG
jgi:ectoine hydroxylase-related dioxygenase (phytanoyl-CoA dioxygenase family)